MRKQILLIFLALNCYGLLTAQSSTPTTDSSRIDKKWATSLITSDNAKFSEQIAAGDSAGLASHYWPDAELLIDNLEPVKGKDIINAWGAAIRMGVKGLTLTTTDITGSSAFIIETGNYEMKDAKQSLLDKGKYVVVWENRNGEWKIYRDIGSTSMPLSK
jgi:ketosteroid isomerase-like protein